MSIVFKFSPMVTTNYSYSVDDAYIVQYAYYNKLIDTDAPEFSPLENALNFPEWNEIAVYNTGDCVKQSNIKRLFSSIVDEAKPVLTQWADKGPINPYRSLDTSLTSGTEIDADTMYYVFETSLLNGITIQGMRNVLSVKFDILDGQNTVLESETISIKNYGVANFLEFISKPDTYKKKFFYQLEDEVDRRLKITYLREDSSKIMSVGFQSTGYYETLGCLEAGGKYKVKSRSNYEADKDSYGDVVGVPVFKNKGSIETLRASFLLSPDGYDDMIDLLDQHKGKINNYLIDGIENIKSLNIIGQHYEEDFGTDAKRQFIPLEIISLKGGN